MDEATDGRPQLSDEESQYMTDKLNSLSEHQYSIWNITDDAIADQIIELSRDPDPSWYEAAKLINDNNFPTDYDFLGYSCWEALCHEHSLPTETIAAHLEIYFKMTALRKIPIKKYEHLPPDRVDDILKSLLRDEPTIPVIAHMDEDLDVDDCGWFKWEKELLASLKAG